jgi:hypothetical protein
MKSCVSDSISSLKMPASSGVFDLLECTSAPAS